MGKENSTRVAKFENIPSRTTRSRAKATELMGGAVNSKPFFECDEKRVLKACTKRPSTDENTAAVTVTTRLQHKRRVVLGDVSNVSTNADTKIFKTKVKPIKERKGLPPNIKAIEDAATVEGNKDLLNAREVSCEKGSELPDVVLVGGAKGKPPRHRSWTKKGSYVHEAAQSLKDESIADIDSNKRDPQMCSLYASDIYYTLRAAELNLRPSSDFMEAVQKDINPSMRGILIDWLIEVSEEYKLVPDTLYLTVNLIDRFLSSNPVEKQRLQLLGVTCMLIASKYEEIFAPRVEEFCFITDNSYTKEEVLRMEIRVLDFLRFRLSVPTTKTFLRRFIRASQAASQAPSIELEFLSNYLAELTLLEYNFLKFLPSIIAASALFLAKWTINQSEYPWNETLEHYTSYASSELKRIVLTMQDLQLNTTGSSLNAVREKYRLEKYKCVAALSSPKHVQMLF